MGHRQRQAQATRDQVAAAARVLFSEYGWVATTIKTIAEAADIPAPTIYSAFGSKAKILEEIKRGWIDQSDVQRQHEEALSQPDPVVRLRMSAHWHRAQMELGYDVISIYQQAARADPAMAVEWSRVLAGRDRAIGKIIDSLAGDLTPGLSRQPAVDRYVACTLAETYRTLVLERNWPLSDFENWTADLLISQLLP